MAHLIDLRRAAWSRLPPAERQSLIGRGFTRAEITAFQSEERATTLAQAARLAAPGEEVRAKAAERLATAWRRYVATRWTIDQHTSPPEQIGTLQQALHRLTVYWRGTALEPDTISRFLRDCYDTDRMK